MFQGGDRVSKTPCGGFDSCPVCQGKTMGSRTTITVDDVFKATADNCEICAGMWFYDDTGECMRCGHLPREKQ